MSTTPDRAIGAPNPPTRWGKDQVVAHRITGRVGEVQGVDFEESLVTVTWRGATKDQDWTAAARMENLWEVVSGQ